MRPLQVAAMLAAGATLAPFGSAAFGDPIVYYNPPRMVKRGTTTIPAPGNGKVVVKVLVNADGTFKVQDVISSTNHDDDAAALDIAKNSVYAPATRGPQKVLAFYDFTLKFVGGAAAPEEQTDSALASAEAMLKANNYSAAQSSLKTYVAAHPNDARGQLDLAVADTFLSAFADAVAAFDKAGTIPPLDRPIAGKAYVENAVVLLNAKDYANGLLAAKHAAEMAPGFASQDTLGVAQLQSGDSADAVTTLEKAHDLGKTDTSISLASRIADDEHLMQAYLNTGDLEKAKAVAAEAAAADAKSVATTQAELASYYSGKAQDASKAGKIADAAALYEQAGAADPAQAALLYTNAAFAYLKMTPNAEDAKAKAAADKALAADPNSATANYAEGIALADQGKKDDAKSYLTKADSLAKAAGNATLATAVEHALTQLAGAGGGGQ